MSLEKIGNLSASLIPDEGTVNGGNSSQLSDGTAGLLMMSATKAKEHDPLPRARIYENMT